MLLYEGSACMQPRTKGRLCHEFMSIVQPMISRELRADSDFGLSFVRLLFRLVANGPNLSPKMRELVAELHRAVTSMFQQQPTMRPMSEGAPPAAIQRRADPASRSWLLQQPPSEEVQQPQPGRHAEVDLDEPLVVWSGRRHAAAEGGDAAASPATAAGPAPVLSAWSSLGPQTLAAAASVQVSSVWCGQASRQM